MRFSDLVGLALDHAGSLLWNVFVGALLWGVLGLAVVIGLFVAARRTGWLAAVARGRRWPGVVLVLVLLAGVGSPLVAAGMVGGVRDTTIDVVREEVGKTESIEALGGLLITPMIAAHAVTEGVEVTALDEQVLQRGDVAFLLDAAARKASAAALTSELLRLAPAVGPDHEAWTWLRGLAEARLARYVDDQRGLYEALFVGLKPDADGGLSFASASRQVGNAFAARHVYPQIASVFDGVRLNLIVTAVLLALAILVTLRWLAGRASRPA